MDDFTLPSDLAAYAVHQYSPANSPTAAQTGSTGVSTDDFKSLMTLMLLSSMNMGGSSMGGSSLGGGSEGMAGMNISQLMAPLMLTLLEKLIAGQVGETAQEESIPQAIPEGSPLEGKGRLTQSSHSGHVALDYGVPVGTPVHTTMDGKVTYAGWNDEGYGNLVIVEQGAYRTYYAHLSKIPVDVGDRVQAGDVIGLSGNTGNSTGPHLHYEIRRNGAQINPTRFVQA